MIIKIFLAIIALFILIYLISRIQMKGWTDELDNKITKYFPDKDGDTKD
jgi:hypothetical protein